MNDSAGQIPPEDEAVNFFRILGDHTRLTLVRALAESDLRVGELVAHVALPQNAVSYHLKLLRGIGLLRDRRSSADSRDVYYSIDQERLEALYRRAGTVLRPHSDIGITHEQSARSGNASLSILFLCTHNSARSQFAEALARREGGQRVTVVSAGDTPTGLHPLAAELLTEWNIDPAEYTSKAIAEFLGRSFDYVITVCDRVREHCPTFPGAPRQLHWSIPDPTSAPEEKRREAFRSVRHEINVRVRHLLRARPEYRAA
jgi:protein-tyrosine-phosphatase/DNA-binding transcriptional ArsR family regulator